MPLFRFHRGGLHESLQTTVIVKTPDDLSNIAFDAMKQWVNIQSINDIELTIEPYLTENNFILESVGTHKWYQLKCKVKNPHFSNIAAHPLGFLSEPFIDMEPEFEEVI